MKKTTSFLTMNDLSEYLQISKDTLYKLTMLNKIPCFKVGKQLRFRKKAIEKWAEKEERARRRKS